ncbi:6155_t:CDS:2 [Ambispora gerdemannii]|uniref:6155_t:CDS:1 n=1 Tax=Ambispora gerdemannii TaxID=144530 RepID=A0A9N8WQE0_9GLOM|nr:6155_t:CDS:2 [Ambispora gerdemannii]
MFIFNRLTIVATCYLIISKYTLPTTLADCQKQFKTSKCTLCQNTLYSLSTHTRLTDPDSPLICQPYLRLADFVSENQKSSGKKVDDKSVGISVKNSNDDDSALIKGIDKFCSLPNPCDSTTAEHGWWKIQTDCADEIQNSYDETGKTIIFLFGVYYFAAPEYETICAKSSSGGYSWDQISFQSYQYIQKNYAQSNQVVYTTTYQFPPETHIDYSFKNPDKMDSSVKTPSSIICSQDFLIITKIYFDFVSANPLKSAFQPILSLLAQLKNNITATNCSGLFDVGSGGGLLVNNGNKTKNNVSPDWGNQPLLSGGKNKDKTKGNNNTDSNTDSSNSHSWTRGNVENVANLRREFIFSIAEKHRDKSKCLTLLGFFFANGFGTPRNIKKVLQFYEKAAKLGDPLGQQELGLLYFYNYRRYKLAFFWLHKATESRMGGAAYYISKIHSKGYGVKPSKCLGMYWLKKSAELGYFDAAIELARFYESGIEQPKNLCKAFYCFKKSVEID